MYKNIFAMTLTAVFLCLIPILYSTATAQSAEEGYFTGSDGNRLFYRKLGAGQPTLVYLHGGPINMNDGGYEIDRLGRGRTLIVIDQRSGGTLGTRSGQETVGVSAICRRRRSFAAHFGLQKMVLAGHHLGHGSPQNTPLRTDRVERLMFWSPAPPTGAFAQLASRHEQVSRRDGYQAGSRTVDAHGNRPISDVVPLCRNGSEITFRFYVSDLASLSRMRETTARHLCRDSASESGHGHRGRLVQRLRLPA